MTSLPATPTEPRPDADTGGCICCLFVGGVGVAVAVLIGGVVWWLLNERDS